MDSVESNAAMADLKAENQELRRLVDEFRAREVAELRRQLAEARELAEHYRAEAHRNVTIGRQIAADYQAQVAELRTKLDTIQQVQTSVRRTTSIPRRG